MKIKRSRGSIMSSGLNKEQSIELSNYHKNFNIDEFWGKQREFEFNSDPDATYYFPDKMVVKNPKRNSIFPKLDFKKLSPYDFERLFSLIMMRYLS